MKQIKIHLKLKSFLQKRLTYLVNFGLGSGLGPVYRICNFHNFANLATKTQVQPANDI